jgi:hypothetical protein
MQLTPHTYDMLRYSNIVMPACTQAGILSAALFSWFTPIIVLGQKKQLDLNDIPHQNTWDRSAFVWYMFTKTAYCKTWWGTGSVTSSVPTTSTTTSSKSSVPLTTTSTSTSSDTPTSTSTVHEAGLALRLFRLNRDLFLAQGTWQFVATLSEFTSPLAMQQIVDFVSSYKGGAVNARTSFFVALLFVGPVIQGIADARNFHMGKWHVYTVWCYAIYTVYILNSITQYRSTTSS